MTPLRSLVAVVGAVLTILVGTPAGAQTAPAARKDAGAAAQAAPEARKKAAPRQILRLEEMKVEGRIQKPQAMFLMPRANLNYGELDRSEPFLPKVIKAVQRPPF